ncbi:BTAD domain-containing putative transcriptional regulator [Streptomyces sp. GESEQ-35]|uniref:AfsR/SARP family transcriptional regulator n=1 Tax=Streptomyces sp. GESEQ-35 TaxID=2812657 RepID=UPI001B32B35D|nr:BTAD domain-containing putative transcriptional regulator [Streptomyces sp. GESEQ-35]
MTDFLLLGTVELRRPDGTVVDLGPAKQRTVLAALLVDAGRWVTVETLIDRVWGEDAPLQVRPSLYAHIARIRRLLAATADGVAAGPQLRRGPGGYLLDVPADQVDVHRFRQLVEQARDTERTDAERVVMLRQALGLWRGEPLAGPAGAWVERTRESWGQERLEAVLAWADAEYRVGRHAEVIGALTALAAEHPLVEPLTVALMRALQAAGRGPEALAYHTVLQKRLAEELGTDPGAEVQQVHQAILRGESAPPAESGHGAPVPAQLPLEARGFTGREEQLARLDGILATSAERPAAVVVSAVSGTAGVGKTALALHWAHRVADRFPDGQLYVNLRGFDPSGAAMAPEQAVRDFLDALGGPAQRVPADLQARAGLYRSLLAGRRVLVVLDNARDADQVRPLLPGSPGCLAVVTSRNRLAGLVAAEGAHPIPLDLLQPAEARALLAHRLGEERVAAEPDAVQEIITRCARLPLALAIATARAAAHPGFPLSAVAEELRDSHGSLDAFTGGDLTTDVRAVFSWSYAALTPVQARLFALLGLVPGPHIGLFALASLTGLDRPATRAALQALENLHLVEQQEPGRWRMHDLVRLYAADRGRQDLAPEEQEAALRRLVGFYLHTACGTLRLMPLDDAPPELGDPGPGCRPQRLSTHAEAVEWLAGELPNVLAAQRLATDRGWRKPVWQFAWSLDQFYGLLGHVHDRVTMWRAALAALDHDDALDVHIRVHRRLGHAATHAGSHDEARKHLRHALNLAEQAGDHGTQARIHISLAQAYGQQDRLRPALEHSDRALRLLQELDLPAAKAAALNSVGWYNARLGDYEQARVHCEAALPLARRARHESIEADILDSLGYIAHHTGRHLEAVDHFRLAVDRYRGSGSDRWAADTLDRLGHAHRALGRSEQARSTWEEAAAMYRDQHRHTLAERVQRRLDDLDPAPGDR